ncbi:MAG: nitroreductase family protein [Spirochaetes bacterium]|nr:nitroreductase family protein [Spirochaetota bacterium]
MFSEIIKKNRSYRVYYEEKVIPADTLLEFVDNARLIPSALNLQPLKYYIAGYDKRDLVFPHLRWAGYLTDWDGPAAGERPSAYIIILSDKNISSNVKWDHGIAAQTILLSAVSKDMGGCMIGNINKESLSQSLNIPDNCTIEFVIALGFPKEKIILKEINNGDDIKYYRDSEGNHYVPKRKLTDIIISK